MDITNELSGIWRELGISGGTALIILIALYFVIKWAVRTAIDESKGEISKAVKRALKEYQEKKPGQPEDEE